MWHLQANPRCWVTRVQMCPYVHYHSVDNWIVQSRETETETERSEIEINVGTNCCCGHYSLSSPGQWSLASHWSQSLNAGIWLAESWDLQTFLPHLIVPGNLKNVQFRRPLPGLIKCLVSFPSCKLSLGFGLCEAFRGGIDFYKQIQFWIREIGMIFASLHAFVQHLLAERQFKTANNQYRHGTYSYILFMTIFTWGNMCSPRFNVHT